MAISLLIQPAQPKPQLRCNIYFFVNLSLTLRGLIIIFDEYQNYLHKEHSSTTIQGFVNKSENLTSSSFSLWPLLMSILWMIKSVINWGKKASARIKNITSRPLEPTRDWIMTEAAACPRPSPAYAIPIFNPYPLKKSNLMFQFKLYFFIYKNLILHDLFSRWDKGSPISFHHALPCHSCQIVAIVAFVSHC